jgi:hypothetical protein
MWCNTSRPCAWMIDVKIKQDGRSTLKSKLWTNNIATRKLGINTDALKFENCKFENYHITVQLVAKKWELSE